MHIFVFSKNQSDSVLAKRRFNLDFYWLIRRLSSHIGPIQFFSHINFSELDLKWDFPLLYKIYMT